MHLRHHCCDTKWFAEVAVAQRTAVPHHNHKINHNTHRRTHNRLPTLTHTSSEACCQQWGVNEEQAASDTK